MLLFLFLEIIALLFTASRQTHPKAFFINSSNIATSFVYSNYFKVTQYFNLKKENNKLLKENRRLKNKLKKIDTISTITKTDSLRLKQYKYITGKVIKNSILSENNFITVNRGSIDGIIKDMGVVGSKGVVGIVTNVSKHFCVVLSVLNKLNAIGCKLKNTSYYGSASWEGKNYRQITLHGIPNHVEIQIGDTVVTSGYGAIFPENIKVGTINSFRKNHKNNFYTIKLDLSVDMKKITNVYLIKNKLFKEQKRLEEKAEELF